MKLVLASNNAKKLKELRALFGGLAIELQPQGELGIGEAEEPHITFIENALAKARHAAEACGGAAMADDSGLCVDALAGEPGVQSAVYLPASAATAKCGARRRTAPTTTSCSPRWTVWPTAGRHSSARWWPSAMPKTPSR